MIKKKLAYYQYVDMEKPKFRTFAKLYVSI